MLDDFTYLDNAATTRLDERVLEAMKCPSLGLASASSASLVVTGACPLCRCV